jgi:hypothetical protein
MVYSRVLKYAAELLAGMPAADVIASMAKVFKTDCSLKNYMSRVRVHILDSEDERKFHPMYHKDVKKVVRMARKRMNADKDEVCRAVLEFTQLSFKDQYKRRLFRKAGISVSGDDEVDCQLSKIRFVPKNIALFRMGMCHIRECRRQTEQHRLIANENLKLVDCATLKLAECRAVIAVAASAHRHGFQGVPPATVPRVAIALLATSGRRTAEILNCKSVFAPGTNMYSAVFTGQLKTQLCDSYEIPLLCEYIDFIDAYSYMKKIAPPMDSARVNAKYASNLGYWSKRIFGDGVTPHDLRRIYATYVYEAFRYREALVSTNAVIKWLLGHSGLGTSLNYTGIIADGITERFDPRFRLQLPKTVNSFPEQR